MQKFKSTLNAAVLYLPAKYFPWSHSSPDIAMEQQHPFLFADLCTQGRIRMNASKR